MEPEAKFFDGNNFFFISLISLLIATYTDLKERIVSDKLTYTLIGGGLLLQLILAILGNSFETFFMVVIVTIATFIGAYLFWKIGLWAGGDVKLFTALAVLNPLNYGVIRDFFGLQLPEFASISLPLFPLTLFIFSIFSMVPLAIIITITGIAKNDSLKKKLFDDTKSRLFSITSSALLVAGAMHLFPYLNINTFFVIFLLIAAGFFGKKIFTVIGILVFTAGTLIGGLFVVQQFVAWFLLAFSIYLFIKLYLLAKSSVLVEKIKITDLEEGMISAQTILQENKKLIVIAPITIKSVINYLRNNNVKGLLEQMHPKGKILASSTNAGGLENPQIEELKKAAKKGNGIGDFLMVKKSVPFVPAVLIAYILTQTVGDLLWQVIF